MFAIIKTGGKQIKVVKGEEIFIEKLKGQIGDKIEFTEILMINNIIGFPILKNAVVIGTIIKQGKYKKVFILKYKPKKNIHKKYGHRQFYTKIKIEDIYLTNTKLLTLNI